MEPMTTIWNAWRGGLRPIIWNSTITRNPSLNNRRYNLMIGADRLLGFLIPRLLWLHGPFFFFFFLSFFLRGCVITGQPPPIPRLCLRRNVLTTSISELDQHGSLEEILDSLAFFSTVFGFCLGRLLQVMNHLLLKERWSAIYFLFFVLSFNDSEHRYIALGSTGPAMLFTSFLHQKPTRDTLFVVSSCL